MMDGVEQLTRQYHLLKGRITKALFPADHASGYNGPVKTYSTGINERKL